MKKLMFAAVAAAALCAPSYAAIIPGLFNTGVNNSGVALVGGNGVVDPHYVILSSTSPGFAGQNAVTFNCCYAADNSTSRWVSLSNNGNPGLNTTTYRLTFSLAGLNEATASLSGSYGTDNSGYVSLNGGAQSFYSNTFQAYTSFAYSSGFVAGDNTLDFIVSDSGPPTSFRVLGLTGTADPAAVPEPASWAMMVGGFGLIGGALRRRNTRVVFA